MRELELGLEQEHRPVRELEQQEPEQQEPEREREQLEQELQDR